MICSWVLASVSEESESWSAVVRGRFFLGGEVEGSGLEVWLLVVEPVGGGRRGAREREILGVVVDEPLGCGGIVGNGGGGGGGCGFGSGG